MTDKNSLLVFRNEINNIDEEIVTLLAKRKHLIIQIAKSKIENHKPIRDIEREKKILKKLVILGKKYQLTDEYITRLFKLIIQESVLIQEKILKEFYKINKLTLSSFSFLGPKGSYSHIAASKYANYTFKKCVTKEYSTFKEVIMSVENNQSDYAVLPIENTCSGFITEIFPLLKKTNLFIIGEIHVFIDHCLLTIQNTKLNDIKTIYSHPQPFKQCSNFLEKFPHWNIKYTESTSSAMKKIAKYNKKYNAALGSEIGSKIYGLNILFKNLSNKEKNITKFILLNRNAIDSSLKIPSKTTLLFSTEKTNIVDNILLTLQENKIIFRKTSFSIVYKNLLEKIFYIDIQANISSEFMQDILKKIKKTTKFMKFLGCYPMKNVFLKKL